MILDTITIYACDGALCRACKLTGKADVASGWFLGITKQFCPVCSNRVANQAAIAADETEQKRIRAEVMARISSPPYEGGVAAAPATTDGADGVVLSERTKEAAHV